MDFSLIQIKNVYKNSETLGKKYAKENI